MRALNQAGLDLIKSFEGLSLKPYLDQANVATIGYGTILYPSGQAVTMSDPEITEDQASQYLMGQVMQKCSGVEGDVSVPLNDNEFAALVSFAYNLGLGALHGSTMLKMLNAGADRSGVADQFLEWDKAGGVVSSGLLRRRQAERSLFLQPMQGTPVPAEGSTDLLQLPSDDDIEAKLKASE